MSFLGFTIIFKLGLSNVLLIIIGVLLILTVSGMILYGKHLSTQQDISETSNISSKQEQYQYIPIPKDRQAEYKAEIEKYIDENVPIIENNIKNFLVNNEEDALLKINTEHLSFYIELVDITNKYVIIDYRKPPTDFVGDWYDFIFPYLKNNKIDNIYKLQELYTYISKIEEQLFK